MTLKEENAKLLESLSKMVDIIYQLVKDDNALENYKAEVETAKKLVDGYVKKEDNYYEETANNKDAKDTDEMPADAIPGTDMMYRPYREPQIDNSAIENHEEAGQESDGQVTVSKNSYPSTELY